MRSLRMPQPAVAVLMSVVLLGACSATRNDNEALSDPEAWDDSGNEDGGGADLESEPTHWRLSATLVVSDGVVQAEESYLDVGVDDGDENELCREAASLSAVDDAAVQPAEFVAWYEVSVDAWDSDCEDTQAAVPAGSSFLLGLGELHPEALALLDTLDEADDSADQSLNGAYASFDGGESAYIFGVGGTAEAFEGVGETPTEGPLADGVWVILPLYSFSL